MRAAIVILLTAVMVMMITGIVTMLDARRDGTAGWPCYPNATCNTGLVCVRLSATDRGRCAQPESVVIGVDGGVR